MWRIFLLFSLIISYSQCKSNKISVAPKQFSDSYTVKGTLYIPYAEIREPFYAWYDLSKGSSRIDYYGGMVKTYQLSKEGEYGSSIKVAPVTTEEVLNEDTCLQVNGTSNTAIQPQSILPDLSLFENIGQEMLNGLPCYKWRLTDIHGDKVNKYTMWTRVKASRKHKGQETAIPVRYEMRGYNTLLGSHYDHYYLEYEWYSDDVPDPNVFRIGKNVSCQSFPGPGENHIYTFNPMKEFIHNYEDHVESAFDNFKKNHNKEYDSPKEHVQRFEVFRQNLRFIHSHNRANRGYELGVNHLADKNDLELKALRGNQYVPNTVNSGQPFPYSEQKMEKIFKDLPESMDWRLNGAVTPVKDQSVCGSCWSFGTTGAIEAAYFLKTGKLIRVSQQALIDCSWGYGNNGCDGGEDFRSYDWMMKHGGIPTEDDYGPYLGQDGYCHVDNSTLTAKITGYVNVTSGDQSALKVALAIHGPISVAIDASHKTFAFYSNGVYYEPECGNTLDQLDHAVLVVGYGKLNGEDYWLVKNSWSNYWGNDGYVLMSLKDNNCGVATDPTYVTM